MSDPTGAEVDRAYAAGYKDGKRDALRQAAEWLRRPENLYGNIANDFDEWRAEQVNP